MSIRRQIQYQYRHFLLFCVESCSSVELPDWLTTVRTRVGLVVALAVLTAGYVAYISLATTRGYQLSALERHIAALQEEQQQLSVQVASYQSLTSVQNRLADLRLVPAAPPIFTAAGDLTAVARR